MSQAEDEAGGIPTRAIHEAYLDMQRALKEYRRAVDEASQGEKERAHGEVQDAVLTLYEMLRPHLQHNNAVSDFWDGRPPSYPRDRDGNAPHPEDGVAILSWQTHREPVTLNGTDPEELKTLEEWADTLGLADSVRLVGVQSNGSNALITYHTYEMGLQHLDNWETSFHTVQTEIGGFMGGKTTPKTTRQRVPIEKLRRAARELSNVIDKLGLHASVKKSRQTYHAGGDDNEYPEPWGTAEKPE